MFTPQGGNVRLHCSCGHIEWSTTPGVSDPAGFYKEVGIRDEHSVYDVLETRICYRCKYNSAVVGLPQEN